MDRSAAGIGVACVLAAILAGTSYASDAPGTAVQRVVVNDWKLFNAADTNGDGLADALWWSASANVLSVWLMNGAHVLVPGPEIPGPPGTGWVPVTTADFNRDGMQDVIWSNADRGTMMVYLLNGTHLLAPGPEIHGPSGEGWVVGNAGDKNGDGLADVVWHNAAKDRFAVWLMNGARVLAPGPELPGPPGEGWAIISVVDTNGDGLGDLVWSNPKTNTVTVMLLNGAHVLAPGPEIPGPRGEGWTAVTSADFNRDGLADVIWSNGDRPATAIWLLNGAHLLAPGPVIPGPPGEGWGVAYAADTNGDGLSDVLWQKSGTSLFSVWLMNGAHVLAPGPVLQGPGEVAGARP